MEHENDLINDIERKIQTGRRMIKRLQGIKIEGVDKLSRKISQEIRFLEKVRLSGVVKREYTKSSNLIHQNAMVERVLSAKDPVSVMKPFKTSALSRLEVDVVCDNGASWIKVIARNAEALSLTSLGHKSVLEHANSYLKCAEIHPYRYKTPRVVFHFACGVERGLARELEKIGVFVEGQRVDGGEMEQLKEEKIVSSVEEIKILNLDVSTLLAYVSNMTNGNANFVYSQPLLTLQAEWERLRPIKGVLDELFCGKKLIVCRTAFENFDNIVRLIGGEREVERTKELMGRVEIVDDAVDGRILELELRGKIKDRSRLVFATGESMKCITVSANEGFVRAARMQGIECTVFLHEPRSLSERKEEGAKRID